MTRKKVLVLVGTTCLILAVTVLSLMTACAAKTPEVITLRFSSNTPQGHPGEGIYVQQDVLDEIARRSNGRIKFEAYFMGSLLGQREVADGLKARTVDIAMVPPVAHPDKFPLTSVIDSVPFEPGTMKQAVDAFWELKDNPDIADEWEAWNMKIIGLMTAPAKEIGSKKPLRSLADIKGVKCRLGSEYHQKIWAAAGGVPVFVPMEELWDALDKGTVEASDSNPEGHLNFKYYESCKYFENITLGCWVGVDAINLDSFNDLPRDLQKIVLEAYAEVGQRTYEAAEAADKSQREQLAELGVEFIDFPASELEKWKNMPEVQGLINDWIKDKESKGLPGQEIMDQYLELLKKYS